MWVVPVDSLDAEGVLAGTVDGRDVVVFLDATGDVAVYEAPTAPDERTADGLRDADGTEWTVERNALRADGVTRERIAGRHGLWFAFRTHYETTHVVE